MCIDLCVIRVQHTTNNVFCTVNDTGQLGAGGEERERERGGEESGERQRKREKDRERERVMTM